MDSTRTAPVAPVALVTGGAIRVGRAIVLALAEAGFDVILSCHTSRQPADESARTVEQLGRRCWIVQADLGDPAEVQRVASVVDEGPGRLDLLVNSAANFHPTPLLETGAAEWDLIQQVNTRGPHLLTRACAEHLRKSDRRGGGAVVNICDHMGITPRVRYGAHSVSKAALAHLTRVQALAMAPDVRVNAVAPGLVLAPEGIPEARHRAEVDRIPLERSGSPDDVAQAVLYLACAPFVTGHLLVVDGGATLGSR